mmetsp:Transcript_2489/g.7958  ORF Transcript_2489/g.7958 Transcript_2489/m.7958 type:complete len:223 (+) Transcript_2489:571-1239(+)
MSWMPRPQTHPVGVVDGFSRARASGSSNASVSSLAVHAVVAASDEARLGDHSEVAGTCAPAPASAAPSTIGSSNGSIFQSAPATGTTSACEYRQSAGGARVGLVSTERGATRVTCAGMPLTRIVWMVTVMAEPLGTKPSRVSVLSVATSGVAADGGAISPPSSPATWPSRFRLSFAARMSSTRCTSHDASSSVTPWARCSPRRSARRTTAATAYCTALQYAA